MAWGLFLHRLDDRAGGGQLLGEDTGALGAGDGLKAVPGSRAPLAADAGNGAGVSAQLRPVGDLAGEHLGDLLHSQVLHLGVGVDDDRDAVQRHVGALQAGGRSPHLQSPGGQADIGGTVLAASIPVPEPVGS